MASAVSLEDLGFDVAELESTFGEYFLSLGEFEGEHYGIPTNINLKSMVWYPKDDFDAAGYTVPTTFDEMIALSDQIKADGGTPWCVGFESEAATGWPATDWMEDIMLATAGTETYTQWVNHEIPFNDPAVQNAGELFGDIMFTDGYVLGGADQTPSIAFGDAPGPMFQDPPGCWLHRQASFITAFFPEDAEAGVDYDWFPFPAVDQQGTLFAGELAVVFSNRPEVVDFLERFMGEDVQCQMGSEPGSSRISPNVNVGTRLLPEPDPRRRIRGADGSARRRWRRRVRRFRPDAAGGGLGHVLDGDDELHARRSGFAPDGARDDRGELAGGVVSRNHTSAERAGAAVTGRSRLPVREDEETG